MTCLSILISTLTAMILLSLSPSISPLFLNSFSSTSPSACTSSLPPPTVSLYQIADRIESGAVIVGIPYGTHARIAEPVHDVPFPFTSTYLSSSVPANSGARSSSSTSTSTSTSLSSSSSSQNETSAGAMNDLFSSSADASTIAATNGTPATVNRHVSTSSAFVTSGYSTHTTTGVLAGAPAAPASPTQATGTAATSTTTSTTTLKPLMHKSGAVMDPLYPISRFSVTFTAPRRERKRKHRVPWWEAQRSRRQENSYRKLIPRPAEESDSSSSSSDEGEGASSSSRKRVGGAVVYDPHFLCGKRAFSTSSNITVVDLPGVRSSIVGYIHSEVLRQELDDRFTEMHSEWLRHPLITFSTLRKVLVFHAISVTRSCRLFLPSTFSSVYFVFFLYPSECDDVWIVRVSLFTTAFSFSTLFFILRSAMICWRLWSTRELKSQLQPSHMHISND